MVWIYQVFLCCEKIVYHCILNVKTAHPRSPKKYVEKLMKEMPGGVWLVMEGRAKKEEVVIVFLLKSTTRKICSVS